MTEPAGIDPTRQSAQFPTFPTFESAELWVTEHNPHNRWSPYPDEQTRAIEWEIRFWEYQESALLALPDIDAEYERMAARERHPSNTRVVREVGRYVHIEAIPEPVPPRSLIGTALGVVLGWSLMALGLAVGITPPALSGRTIVGAGLIGLGGAIVVRITRVTKGKR
jgi:hypothetical protein